MKSLISFIAGAMCGAVVGAAAVLLFTPQSGHELQERLRSQYQFALKEGQRAAADRRAELEAQLATLKQSRQPQA